MSVKIERFAFVAVAGLMWLAGCETTTTSLPDLSGGKAAEDVTGSVPASALAPALPDLTPANTGAPPNLLTDNPTPSAPHDDLSVGREQFRQGNYGLSERHCRKAVETAPRDANAWLCLAASYDRLKRFDLADRAYGQIVALVGRGPAVLNNIGYSYILRGDFARARETLLTAQKLDPNNLYVHNNLALLAEAVRRGEPVR
ncbi:hypothetical protein A33M_1991 [Rhodovulum sp. PH10]|uniref:tetratricopeptide repeat protein n=1 Tax=Rhodovulum sp. PH10 TaxID=1187851 RepID=UPI00027C2B1B|nr:tetratricopeptide repeat protein [Rhodovulum sp. PH10]EJW12420.1 hypothetical protein A33M_1991 [Rhodovulum sp. PH10]